MKCAGIAVLTTISVHLGLAASPAHAACEPGARFAEQVLQYALSKSNQDKTFIDRYSMSMGRMNYVCELFRHEFNVSDTWYNGTELYILMRSGGYNDALKVAQSGCSKSPYKDHFRYEIYFVSYIEALKPNHPGDYSKMERQYRNSCTNSVVRFSPESD